MIYPSHYPENGHLIEWSEEQQTFYINEVNNRKLNKQTNMHGITPVAACDTLEQAHLIMNFVEDLLRTRGALAYGKRATNREIELCIKKLVTFSDKQAKLTKKFK